MKKNRLIAVIITFFGGGFGLHKFYLGENFMGILYLIFSWAFIPSILAFFDFLGLLFMENRAFDEKYNYRYLNLTQSESSKDKTTALIDLKKLYDQGVITAEEFEENRRKILEPIRNLSTKKQTKIDINTCSKDELVYQLNLPIFYANDIDAVRRSGYLFTHVEELHEIAGLPENYIKKLAPLVTFSYDINKEIDVSWQRLNVYSIDQLMRDGLDAKVAQKIVQERDKNGVYKSVIDIQHRTGLPVNYYRHLI
ncbi:TM2 domain containing protein [Rippkaea orientalis PCC 8801]|uniref:TM2 domain containing protein n=1 Tax=Rippkaea orientalis (strain PCC 8801 / RF-1) TaxID=41431 RepID=B7JZT2_RIPO1|nr:helix-hairpin-helix domain-containing protein [Rippkaea orientalis]ACK65025.1 TM2 domain containing protein [Rippkaea orientalis PCC 8801]